MKKTEYKSEECIFYQIAKTNQAAQKFWNKKIQKLNITPVQGMVLNFLLDQDMVTSKSLGERTKLDSATLTGVLDRLEAMDLTIRKPNPDDRRAILVKLTDKGGKMAKQIRKAGMEANKEFLNSLEKNDSVVLRELLIQLRAD
jgi:DNA-binding MarR family transcriptional regulator